MHNPTINPISHQRKGTKVNNTIGFKNITATKIKIAGSITIAKKSLFIYLYFNNN